MSEFSDSYHLHTGDPTEVVALLRRARRYGAVLPTSTPFVPFLVDGASEAGGVAEDVVTHNTGVLVHYSYAEDHGLEIGVFEKSSCIATISIQCQRSPKDDTPRPKAIAAALVRSGIVGRKRVPRIERILARARNDSGATPLEKIRDELVGILGLSNVEWLSCADLTRSSETELLDRFPDATFVLKSRRGKADKERSQSPKPNRWCPRPGMPAFMYLAVPKGRVDEAMLARHLEHWEKTGDWDGASQSGFWLYTAYTRALPARMRFLANRIMNLWLAFGDAGYWREMERTLRGILAIAPRDFDWEPYLARKKGEQRL